jgi:hypothetical protein
MAGDRVNDSRGHYTSQPWSGGWGGYLRGTIQKRKRCRGQYNNMRYGWPTSFAICGEVEGEVEGKTGPKI